MRVESVTPYATSEGKSAQIARAFDTLAPRYDLLNRILSLGLDLGWRRRALASLKPLAPHRLLDVATGTGDLASLAARLLPHARITGVDLSEAMLAVGRAKLAAAGLSGRVTLLPGDALALAFPDASFDAVTVAFGVRNFADLAAGFRELRRVLAPGGRLIILELSVPEPRLLRPLHRLYLFRWIPLVGRLLTGHGREYTYLPASVASMPQGAELLALLRAAGFTACRYERFTFGACTCYQADRPSA